MDTSDQDIDRKPLNAPCKYCGSRATFLEMRWEFKKLGTYSLAGVQDKAEATQWPWGVCDGCGHESRGVYTSDE